MSWLSTFFKGGKNPADAAMPYLNQIPGVGHDAYDPYISQGRQAGDRLGGEYDRLLSDPNAFINSLMEGYTTSDAYKYKSGELGRALESTQAAGGMAGTPYSQKQQGELISGLLSQDMQQYLQNVLGAYDRGLSGEQDIYGKGFQASGALGDFLGSNLTQQGSLAFQGQSQKNANQQALVNAIMKLMAQGAGGAMGMPNLPGFGPGVIGG